MALLLTRRWRTEGRVVALAGLVAVAGLVAIVAAMNYQDVFYCPD